MDQHLKIEPNRGKFIKPCPGTPQHVCCGYQIINFARGCRLGCSYCVLSYYFKNQPLVIFSNREKLFQKLDEYLRKRKKLTRFGTGEFTDSLLFEKAHPLYHRLIPLISRKKNAVLEIKTKTTNIDPLMNIEEHRNVMVSWSLNSEYIRTREERGAPGIRERIDAAASIQKHGYRLGFHFDPIIVHPQWEQGYKKTIDMLFEKIDPRNVVYISMGTLRFMHEMLEIMEQQESIYTGGEFIRGVDNKLRYFRPLRTRVYIKIKQFLTRYVPGDILYLCMESPVVWNDVFGIQGMSSSRLSKRLDVACTKKFPDLVKY